MADAQASGACGRKIVWVQVPSPAFFYLSRIVAGYEKARIYMASRHSKGIKILRLTKKSAPFLPHIFNALSTAP